MRLSRISEASYIVYQDDPTNPSMYYVEDGRTGQIEYTSSDGADAIQYAINKANTLGGGVVFLRRGLFLVSRTVTLKSGVKLVGEGIDITVLKVPIQDYSFGTVIDIDGASGVEVVDLTIDRNGTKTLSDSWVNMGLSGENCSDVAIRRVKIINTMNYAMVFGGNKQGDINTAPYAPCRNVVVESCKIVNSYKDGIHFFGGENIWVVDNYLEKLVDDAVAFSSDINYPVSNVVIRGNIVRKSDFQWTNGVKLNSGWQNLATPANGIFSNIIISENEMVEVAQEGVSISLENSNASNVDKMANNLIIANNRLKSIFINSADRVTIKGNVVGTIRVTPGAYYISLVTGVYNVNIVGNVVSNINIPGYPGVTSGNLMNVNINDNLITGEILIGSPAKYINVVGNMFMHTGGSNSVRVAGDPSAPPQYVLISGNLSFGNGIIWNNYIVGYETGKYVGTNVLILNNIGLGAKNYSVATNPNCSNIFIAGNYGDKGIDIRGTNVVVKRNYSYITEKSGVAKISAGSTRVTVTHGLASAPSRVLVTPYGNIRVWVENITSTSFDIVTDTAPTTDINVAWYAEV